MEETNRIVMVNDPAVGAEANFLRKVAQASITHKEIYY
jgi:hypothetical protein